MTRARAPRPRRLVRATGLVVALLVVLIAQSPAAVAQPENAAPAAGETEAQALFRRGVEALRAEQYAVAAGAFESSYALDPKPAALCNTALAYDRWGGHALQAVKAYQRCARNDDSGRFRDYAFTRAEALLATLTSVERASVEPDSTGDEQDVSTGDESDAEGATAHVSTGASTGQAPGHTNLKGQIGGAAERHEGSGEPRIQVRDGRSHPLLIIGVGAAALAAGALITGLVLVSSANADIEELDEKYGGSGEVVIPAGTSDARLFMDAEDKSELGVIMYVASGVLALAAGTLIAVDLALPDVDVAVEQRGATVRWRAAF